MYNITLICTAHKEIGKCNSIELYKIIGKLRPEVIFEELSLAAYDECYGIKNRLTLETSAIKMYLQKHKVEHIPVVGTELTTDLDKKFEIMTKNVSYRNLLDNLMTLEEKYGFQFLNSNLCDELFENIKMLEKLILKDSSDEILFRISQYGDKIVDTYENEIIKNIYRYSTQKKYDKALMFIGAAHRKSIMRKLQEYEKKESLTLNKTFYNNQDYENMWQKSIQEIKIRRNTSH